MMTGKRNFMVRWPSMRTKFGEMRMLQKTVFQTGPNRVRLRVQTIAAPRYTASLFTRGVRERTAVAAHEGSLDVDGTLGGATGQALSTGRNARHSGGFQRNVSEAAHDCAKSVAYRVSIG
jgi:hypothetical protein